MRVPLIEERDHNWIGFSLSLGVCVCVGGGGGGGNSIVHSLEFLNMHLQCNENDK